MSDWTYERTFEVDATFLQHRVVQLVSLGIDTIASIYVNGHHVFDSSNMFHRVRLDVKSHLVAGKNNTIRVVFTSKVGAPRAQHARSSRSHADRFVACSIKRHLSVLRAR